MIIFFLGGCVSARQRATQFDSVPTSGQGTYTWPDGSTYFGGWKDGKPNGHGILTYSNGSSYVGEFKDGKPTGQGTYTWPNGSTGAGSPGALPPVYY